MKKFLLTIALAALSLGLIVLPNESEARRFGGGASIGRQQSAPPSRVAPQQNAAQSTAAPAAGAAGAAAKPGFMQRFGPMLAGLGLGVLFASLFGGNLAGMLGGLLTVLLVVAGLFLAYRFFMARKQPAVTGPGMRPDMQYAGAPAGGFGGSAQGSLPPPDFGRGGATGAAPYVQPESYADAAPMASDSPETAALVRIAEAAFIRLQAANDARDLDDIRRATTPEIFAEISMQLRERGDAEQYTEVVELKADPLELTDEGDFGLFSVRYSGLIREARDAEPQSFREVWHFRRNLKDPAASWLIAGIQQV